MFIKTYNDELINITKIVNIYVYNTGLEGCIIVAVLEDKSEVDLTSKLPLKEAREKLERLIVKIGNVIDMAAI